MCKHPAYIQTFPWCSFFFTEFQKINFKCFTSPSHSPLVFWYRQWPQCLKSNIEQIISLKCKLIYASINFVHYDIQIDILLKTSLNSDNASKKNRKFAFCLQLFISFKNSFESFRCKINRLMNLWRYSNRLAFRCRT